MSSPSIEPDSARSDSGSVPDAEPQPVNPAKSPSRRLRVWLWASALTVVAVVAGVAAWLGVGQAQGPTTSAIRAERAPVVRTAHILRRDIVVHHEYRGELVADVAELSAQTVGELRDVRVQLGDTVRKNQVLALVDAAIARRQLTEARAQVDVAKAEQSKAQAELVTAEVERDRADALLREQLITEQEALAARSRIDVLQAQLSSAKAQAAQAAARASLLSEGVAQTQLLAPFDGAVAQRYLDPGAVVQPGTPILRLVADGPLRVRFRVPENALSLVTVGQPLTLSTQSTLAESFAGRVTRRSAEVSPIDRSVAVEGELHKETASLLPGMYAKVTVDAETLTNVLAVPNAALVERHRGGQPLAGVFAVNVGDEQPTAHFVPVNVRGQDGQFAAIEPINDVEPGRAPIELNVGTQVVTFGADVLSDGAKVRLSASEQASEPAVPPSAEPIVR